MSDALSQFWNDIHARNTKRYPGRVMINFADFQRGARIDSMRGVPGVGGFNMAMQDLKSDNAARVAAAGAGNRTPSAEHVAHLENLYGSGGGGGMAPGSGGAGDAPGKPGAPGMGVAREALEASFYGKRSPAFGPDSPIEDERDGIFGPLSRNMPPRGRPGSNNLSTFLSQSRSRVR